MSKILLHVLRYLACALFVVYCLWNAYWLAQRQIPPSLFLACTGLPSPTTGGARSAICLLHGQWQESLRWNLFTIPIAALFAFTLLSMARPLLARRPLRLSNWFLYAWLSLLTVAWVCKLLGSDYR